MSMSSRRTSFISHVTLPVPSLFPFHHSKTGATASKAHPHRATAKRQTLDGPHFSAE
jgi:hypothetical protein